MFSTFQHNVEPALRFSLPMCLSASMKKAVGGVDKKTLPPRQFAPTVPLHFLHLLVLEMAA